MGGKIGDDLCVDYTVVGDTTNLAARLQQLVRPGTMVISAVLHRLVAGFFDTHIPAIRYLLAVNPGDVVLSAMEPAVQRKQLVDAMLALALRGAQLWPLPLVYEDLHWSDTSMEAALPCQPGLSPIIRVWPACRNDARGRGGAGT